MKKKYIYIEKIELKGKIGSSYHFFIICLNTQNFSGGVSM